MIFSLWSELVTYLGTYSSVMCEKRIINSNFDTVFICSIPIVDTRVQLLECIFVISKRLVKFYLFGIDIILI